MKFITILAIFVSATNAWWGTGHLLVARIAETLLEKNDPDTFKAVLEMLTELKKTHPAWTENEDKHPFTECATYADDLKGHGADGNYQRGWHFIDEPYLDEGGKISDFKFKFDTHNITEVINALEAWFNKDSGYDQTYEYQQIMAHNYKENTEKNGMSTAMRLLIHYCGDIHQPLHATSRVDHEYPKGDFGGNTFKI